ncbi:hypothetical protein [Streptomyces sp. NPDC005877]|uniref:hypothetical protein n=1 Tax=Streptomyces sp. NPDC005877 TaxID=3155346 RepID=UPI00340AB0A6
MFVDFGAVGQHVSRHIVVGHGLRGDDNVTHFEIAGADPVEVAGVWSDLAAATEHSEGVPGVHLKCQAIRFDRQGLVMAAEPLSDYLRGRQRRVVGVQRHNGVAGLHVDDGHPSPLPCEYTHRCHYALDNEDRSLGFDGST